MSMMYARNLVDLHLKYYSDHHDVDEDMKAITAQGGDWGDDIRVGAARRTMNDTPTAVGGAVAYKYNKNSTPVNESRVLNDLFKFVDMSNYGKIMWYCVYRTLK